MNSVKFCLIIMFLSTNFFAQKIEFLYGNRIYLPQDKSDEMKYFGKNNVLKNSNHFHTSQNTLIDSCVKIDSIIAHYSSGTKERRLFKYNDDKIESFVIQYYNNMQWDNSWKITNEYDSLGRQISRLVAMPSNSLWEASFLDSYFYDSFGNNTESLTQVYNIDHWEYLFKVINDYDDYGDIVYSHIEDWDGSDWLLSSTTSFSYFENGLKEAQLFEIWKNNSLEKHSLATFKYNEDWEKSEVLTQLWSGGKWVYSGRVTSKYSSNKKIDLLDIWESNFWNKYSKTSYTLNRENYIDRGINEISYNAQWVKDDGLIIIENPNGFFQAFFALEVLVYYAPLTDIKKREIDIPTDFRLFQNYPNPFNPTTIIAYQIPEDGSVNLIVYNTLGQVVSTLVNKHQTSGKYSVQFDASNLPSGVYFYKLESNNFVKVNKMLLLR